MGQSAKSFRKESRNTLAENYLSTQFNVSERNVSNEQSTFGVSGHKKQFSNFSINQDLPVAAKGLRAKAPPVSQKFLEVPSRHEFKMIKQKRVKSQVQIQPENNTLNFTSINRINREIRNSRRQHSQYYQDAPGSAQSKSIQSYHQKSPSNVSAREAPDKSVSRDDEPRHCFEFEYAKGAQADAEEPVGRGNEDDFFYEQFGNIYCKRPEDYCPQCRQMLRRIRRKCGSCGKGDSAQGHGSDDGSAAEEDCVDTCLNCWNTLSNQTENCPQCGDEVGARARNLTFGNRIMIRKKSSINQIGETLVDFDDKFQFGNFPLEIPVKPAPSEISPGRPPKPSDSFKRSEKEAPRKDLSIHIPGSEIPAQKSKFK